MDLFDLDRPLIEFASDKTANDWTIRHAVEGVQIFGGIGSGKTSGSGRMLAVKYLSAGFGGLVLTVKPDEKENWQEYCRITNREDDLIIMEPGGAHSFDFLGYESAHTQGGQAITENIVEVLKTVISAGNEKTTGKTDDTFWQGALDLHLFNTTDLCKIAYGTVSIELLYEIAQTIPKGKENLKATEETKKKAFFKAFDAAVNNTMAKVKAWEETFSQDELEQLEENVRNKLMEKTIPDTRLVKFMDNFFFESFATLSDKTRSIIDFMFQGFLFRLLREPIYSLFCNDVSTVKPEDCLNGKIILINLPVKEYNKAGRDCQILFKYIWQRAMERRDIKKNPRPVFLWADEAQNFLHEHDADYQATARSSRIATVYISQNLPNYYASMGGERSEYRVKSFLGTLGTKIFHANADVETNRYASELIGDAFFEDLSSSDNMGNNNYSLGKTRSLKLERQVRPEAFVSLRTGGPKNNLRVDGYLHKQGDPIIKGYNHTKIMFNQNYQP